MAKMRCTWWITVATRPGLGAWVEALQWWSTTLYGRVLHCFATCTNSLVVICVVASSASSLVAQLLAFVEATLELSAADEWAHVVFRAHVRAAPHSTAVSAAATQFFAYFVAKELLWLRSGTLGCWWECFTAGHFESGFRAPAFHFDFLVAWRAIAEVASALAGVVACQQLVADVLAGGDGVGARLPVGDGCCSTGASMDLGR